MVSEPGFVLGIKQKSLASNEDPHVHFTIISHTCLFAGSGLHGILQPPWLCVMSKSNNQAICASPYQICAHQDFACRNQPHKRAPRPPARKTQKSGQLKSTHAPRLAPKNLPHAASDSSLLDRLFGPCAAQTTLLSTDLLSLRIWWSYDVARASTRHLGF